ncbi:MAG: stage III sporulation protein AE, partial [Oscillospiraceae bacterium]|nr:stage III sporulation protein AE [Oscillospiraceae bacterium]
MNTVKKIFVIFIIAIFTLDQPFVLSVQAVHEVQTRENSYIAEELGIDTSGLNDNLTPEARDLLEENGLTVDNPEAMAEITPKDVFLYVWEEFKKSLVRPLAVLVSLLAVILISALIEGMEDSIPNKSLSKIFGVICVLISVGIISESVSGSISRAAEALNSGGTFMIGYVPVFAGITASSGGITSAVAYNMLVVLVAQVTV